MTPARVWAKIVVVVVIVVRRINRVQFERGFEHQIARQLLRAFESGRDEMI